MFLTLFSITFLVTSAIQSVLAGSLTIPTPTLTQCQQVDISWSSSTPPYNLIVVNSAEPCGDALVDLGDHTVNHIQWKVALPAGSKVELSVEDGTGAEAWSGHITVAKSDDTSCLSPAQLAGLSHTSSVAHDESGTTLVVTPTTTLEVYATSTTQRPVVSAIGGVGNAGANPLGVGNGALPVRQASTFTIILSAFAAVLVICL